MADEKTIRDLENTILELNKLIAKKLQQSSGIETAFIKGRKTMLEKAEFQLKLEKEIIARKEKEAKIEQETLKVKEQIQKNEKKTLVKLQEGDTLLGRINTVRKSFFKNKADALKRTLRLDKISAAKDFIMGTEEQRERKAAVKKQKLADKESLTRKEDPKLKEMKKQTILSRKTLEMTRKLATKGGIAGLLAGLALLVGAGGLLGFFLTGKKEFLFSVIKGFTKAGGILGKKMLKPFLGLGEMVGKRLAKSFKPIGSLVGKLLRPVGKAFTRTLKPIGSVVGKLLRPIGKAFGSIFKVFGKGAAKTATKGLAKGGGKSLLKKIPGIGLLMGIVFGVSRFKSGDIIGGLLEIGSGLASTVPVVGTAVSIAIDAITLFRDFKNIGADEGGEGPTEVKEGPSILSGLFNSIKSVVTMTTDFFKWLSESSPIKMIGKVFGALSFSNIKKMASKVMKGMKDDPAKLIGNIIGGIIGGITNAIIGIVKSASKLPLVGKLIAKAFGTDELPDDVNLMKPENLTPQQPTTAKPGAQHGAIVTQPQEVFVGEGGVPEAIIPLSKLDDAYREFIGRDLRKDATGAVPTATTPDQIREIREEGDKGDARLEKLQTFLMENLVPAMARKISEEIERNKNTTSPEVPAGVF